MKKAPYKTKQYLELLRFFEEHPNTHIQAADLRAYFLQRQSKMGLATIYRQLEKMVQEGKLIKYMIDHESGACYELATCAQEEEEDLHFKCKKCGKLLHVHCHEVEHLHDHFKEDHGFLLDPHRTVFYGLCAECQKH